MTKKFTVRDKPMTLQDKLELTELTYRYKEKSITENESKRLIDLLLQVEESIPEIIDKVERLEKSKTVKAKESYHEESA